MTLPPPTSARPRNPFEGMPEPAPFHRSPEFQRFVWLALGLVVVGIVGLYFASGPQHQQAAALPPLLGPQEREAREQRLSTIFEGSLADTSNGQDFVETTGYRRLLQILMSYPSEEVSRRAVRKLDWAASMADPDAWRGEFVWTRGLIAELWASKLRDPLFGTSDVYQGILTQADASEGIFFDLVGELPAGISLRNAPIDVQGIFYRTARYTTSKPENLKEPSPYRTKTPEGEVQEIPYLLLKTMRPVEKPRSNVAGFLQDHTAAALVGLALAIAAARLLMYVFQRRSRRPVAAPRAKGAGFRELFEKKLREKNRTAGPRSEA
jgi:heme exporter protein D